MTVTESSQAPPFDFRPQLPPVHIQLANEIDLSEKDLATQQTDRSRLFAHERGNWALSVFAFGKISLSSFTLTDCVSFRKSNVRHTWIR